MMKACRVSVVVRVSCGSESPSEAHSLFQLEPLGGPIRFSILWRREHLYCTTLTTTTVQV